MNITLSAAVQVLVTILIGMRSVTNRPSARTVSHVWPNDQVAAGVAVTSLCSAIFCATLMSPSAVYLSLNG